MLAINSIVAIYDAQRDLETAVQDLQQSAFDLKNVSIVGREHESSEQVLGYYVAGGRLRCCGTTGAFWNDLWSNLQGGGQFAIPGVGRVLVAGPVTTAVVSAMEGHAIEGLSAVGAGLHTMSIPKAGILRYESALKAHKLLLVADGAIREVLRLKDVLRESQPREINIHFASEGIQSAA